MHLKNWLVVIVAIVGSLKVHSQDPQASLEKVIPVSPTAASIAKYGNTPVGFYTGSPSISIPLFEGGAGSLKVPVVLNYQYNGLKVEEIASWVGLGWSLQSGGVISRTVRGIPDEDTYGFINIALSGQMTAKFMAENITNSTYEAAIQQNLKQAGKGLYDTEADIFHFSFPGYSGKFFYDQELMKFRTLPAQNLSIIYDEGDFIITTEMGMKHVFAVKEITTSSNTQCTDAAMYATGAIVTSSWYLSEMINNTGTDQVSFEYSDVHYSFDNLSNSSKYFLILSSGQAAPGSMPPDFLNNLCWQTTTLAAKRLTFIRFRNGYLKFTVAGTERCDLPGEKALEKVELFTLSDQLVKRYRFAYGYFGGASDYGTCTGTAVSQRLKLKSVTQEDGAGQSLNPHAFEYEEAGTFPGRLSYAQDHWGYYNGVTSNQDLIPTTYYQDIYGNARYVAGAERKPDFNYAKLGAIKKVVYPTKGTTEFLFEGNEVNEPSLQPDFNIHTEFLEGDHVGTQTSYEKTFVINESSNYYNFNNPAGGAYLDISFDAIGCTFLGGPSTCAILTLEGVSPGAPSYGPFTENLQGTYLPNGTYKLKATFNQSPALFADFYYRVTWRQPILTGSYPVGGIRIKKLTDDDQIDPTKKIVRVYSYANPSTNFSSGKVNGTPGYYATNFVNEFYSFQNVGMCIQFGLVRTYKKMTSVSTYPLIAMQGSYVGYEYVTESYGQNAENGKSLYKYQQFSDIVGTNPSFITSREWLRGMVLEDTKLAKSGTSTFTPKMTTSYQYDDLRGVDASILKITPGLKTYFETTVDIQGNRPCESLFAIQRKDEASIPLFVEYETITGNSTLATKNQLQYENVTLQVSEQVTYHPSNYAPKETTSSTSDGDVVITRTKFNIDYTLAGGQPAWLQQLTTRKISNAPVERLTIRKKSDGTEFVTAGIITEFAANRPVPEKVYVLEITTPILLSSLVQSYVDGSGNFIKDSRYNERALFNAYDQYNNLLSQQKKNDNNHAYLWGHQSIYPLAEAVNARHNEIFFNSFEESDGWASPLVYDLSRPHAGRLAGKLGGGQLSHYNGWQSVSLSGPTTFIYSGWVYSEGPSASLYLIMKRASESGYASYTDVITTNTSGKWVFVEKEFTVPADVTQMTIRVDNNGTVAGNVWFDDIRLHPRGAQMTTYTYDPLIGVTSMADINNRFTHYEYDGYGRLALVRDHDRNIATKFCYNYAGQVETCGAAPFTNAVKSGSFTRNNCAEGGVGSSVVYTVAAGTYTSMISQADADQMAQNDINANGQSYANTHGTCTWYNQSQSGNFTRNNCAEGGIGGTVTYTVPSGSYSSAISLAAANAQAISDVSANGQSYANANASCTWNNQAQSGNFTRNNCIDGGTGGTVTYTVAANSYSSTTSLAHANQLAVNAVNANGQSYANANAGCTWNNQAQSGNFTRNNCIDGGTGGTVTYTVAANSYSSTTSLAHANQLAVNAVNASGQSYANANAGCTWYNQAQSGNFTRNNCIDGGTGGTATYTVAASSYSSTTSLAHANQLAVNAVNANGQAYANTNGSCTWYNQVQSGSFTRNNCVDGGIGGTVTYTVAAGAYNSTSSLAIANQLAINAVNANGQLYANLNAGCTWYNQVQTGNFTRNNCASGYQGSTVIYTVAANLYSSTTSLAHANQQAANQVISNGQSYANANGACTYVCSSGNCSGVDMKCVNNVCEQGIKVYTGNYQNFGICERYYHYEWSDGSWSITYTEFQSGECPTDN